MTLVSGDKRHTCNKQYDVVLTKTKTKKPHHYFFVLGLVQLCRLGCFYWGPFEGQLGPQVSPVYQPASSSGLSSAEVTEAVAAKGCPGALALH